MTLASEFADALSCGPTTQCVYQHRAVKDKAQSSSDTVGVCATLAPDPFGRVVIPLIGGVVGRIECANESIPARLIIKGLSHRFGDKGTALPSTDSGIEPCNKLLIQGNVQTHGHKLTH